MYSGVQVEVAEFLDIPSLRVAKDFPTEMLTPRITYKVSSIFGLGWTYNRFELCRIIQYKQDQRNSI